MQLNANLVETLFLSPDGRTQPGWRKIGEQLNGYGSIPNLQTGGTPARLCTLVLQDLDDGLFWGVDFMMGIPDYGSLDVVNFFPWQPRGVPVTMGQNIMIELVPLDKVVTTTYHPRTGRR
jgi:hypothetical protein